MAEEKLSKSVKAGGNSSQMKTIKKNEVLKTPYMKIGHLSFIPGLNFGKSVAHLIFIFNDELDKEPNVGVISYYEPEHRYVFIPGERLCYGEKTLRIITSFIGRANDDNIHIKHLKNGTLKFNYPKEAIQDE